MHGLLVMVLLMEDRDLMHPLPAARKLPDTWIHLYRLPRLEARGESPRTSNASGGSAQSLTAPPSTTLPVPAPAPPDSPEVEPTSSDAGVTTGIDWRAAADRLAARNWAVAEPESGFSGNPQAMRKPCKPRDSSFEWSPAEEKAGFFPLPYLVIAERCVIGLGFFSCGINEGAPPSKHLFDDMQAGRTPDSSVPDPDSCE